MRPASLCPQRWRAASTLALGAAAWVLASCITPAPEQVVEAPFDATRFLDLDIMPPVYELLTPPPSLQATLGLRPSLEAVSEQLIPTFRDWAAPAPQELYQTGQASWYGDRFHGRLTANGERYNMHAMTAAHRTLPFGTEVCVRSLLTGKEVMVRINDRGPYVGRRVIDLSRGAATRLEMISQGIKQVALWVPDQDGPHCGTGQVALHGEGEPAPTN